jgi:hypothetical protein
MLKKRPKQLRVSLHRRSVLVASFLSSALFFTVCLPTDASFTGFPKKNTAEEQRMESRIRNLSDVISKPGRIPSGAP